MFQEPSLGRKMGLEEHRKNFEQGPEEAGPALTWVGRQARPPLSQRSAAFPAGTPT